MNFQIYYGKELSNEEAFMFYIINISSISIFL
jgi:hypothetical protein